MLKKKVLLLLLGLLPAICFSAPSPTPEELKASKDWLYTVTPDQLVADIANWKKLETGKMSVQIPEMAAVLSEKGTLVLTWKDPVRTDILGLREDEFILPQVEKKDFVVFPKADPWSWIQPAGIGALVGLSVGLILDLVFFHK